jgi:hypothetical protein
MAETVDDRNKSAAVIKLPTASTRDHKHPPIAASAPCGKGASPTPALPAVQQAWTALTPASSRHVPPVARRALQHCPPSRPGPAAGGVKSQGTLGRPPRSRQTAPSCAAMIGKSLNFLRRRLDAHLRVVAGIDGDSGTADRVVFVEGDKLEPLSLPQGCISMLVVHVQEDRQFRDANRYQRCLAQDASPHVETHYPDVHLDIGILFAARFKDYANAWDQLSEIILFFQQNPLFDASDAEISLEMPNGVSRIGVELLSPALEQQQDIWSALRLSIHPAVLYRIRLMALRGPAWQQQPQPVHELRGSVRPIPSLKHDRSPPTSRSTATPQPQ